MVNDNYWFAGWLESNKIKSADQADDILSSKEAFEEFVEVARAWRLAAFETIRQEEQSDATSSAKESIVAGPGISPGSEIHCAHSGCVESTLERLLNVSLLYYESIILPDTIGDRITEPDARLDEDTRRIVHNTIVMLQRIEAVGADSLMRFTPTDMEITTREEYELPWTVRRLIRAGLTYKWLGNNQATVYHKFSEHTWLYTFMSGEMEESDDLNIVAEDIAPPYARQLIVTASNCANFDAPLGNVDTLYQYIHSYVFGGGEQLGATFSMPSLRNVPAARLVELRLRYPEVFSVVRGDLRKARDRAGNGVDVADTLDSLVLIPAFREIEGILSDYSQKVKRETGVGAGVIGLPTIIAASMAADWSTALMTAGSGVASILRPAMSAYVEKRRRLANNPYTLLWQAAHRRSEER